MEKSITNIPVGQRVTVNHYFLIAECGYWGWDNETITGKVISHSLGHTEIMDQCGRIVRMSDEKTRVIN